MLRVLQHYFPVRSVLLVVMETVLLGGIIAMGMTQHLWALIEDPAASTYAARAVSDALTPLSLLPGDAARHCVIAGLLLTVVAQICVGLNRLYEFQISASKIERASRFVESAGAAIVLTTLVSSAARYTSADALFAFPGLTLTQTVQHLGTTLALGFAVLYAARFVFHMLVRRADLDVRVLILGSRGPAHALANQISQHPEAGFAVIGLVPEPDTTIGRHRGDGEADLVTASEEASSEATRALVLQDIHLLGREIEKQGAVMRGAAPAETGQGEESLLELVEKLAIETVVIALEDRRLTLPIEDLLKAKLAGVEVREREEIYEQVTGRIAVGAMRPSYLIFNEGFRRHPWAALVKRTVDVVVSVVMLMALWPVM
ncbi:MAG: hypothetical protein VXW31_08860, partial [Planctomycetota bacterium]|nr:hypothetical protein [Planctomycetota bacterium]